MTTVSAFCSVCILPQPAFYSQSSVCILPHSLRFTLTVLEIFQVLMVLSVSQENSLNMFKKGIQKPACNIKFLKSGSSCLKAAG